MTQRYLFFALLIKYLLFVRQIVDAFFVYWRNNFFSCLNYVDNSI